MIMWPGDVVCCVPSTSVLPHPTNPHVLFSCLVTTQFQTNHPLLALMCDLYVVSFLFWQNYFGDPWNVLDFIIVVGSIVDIIAAQLMVCSTYFDVLYLFQPFSLACSVWVCVCVSVWCDRFCSTLLSHHQLMTHSFTFILASSLHSGAPSRSAVPWFGDLPAGSFSTNTSSKLVF